MIKIAILGTRGIPNNYGGFEQFAEYLSKEIQYDFDVTVYSSHNHVYQKDKYENIRIKHVYDPEYIIGTMGQFVYDFNCIRDIRRENHDIILQLGYTSSSVFNWLIPNNNIIITNMDGLEWKRTKYNKWVQLFLKYAEKLAVKNSDHLISDSIGIQNYIVSKYKKDSSYIPYGANIFADPKEIILQPLSLNPYSYDLLIARIEPENSIKTIMDAKFATDDNIPLVIIGSMETPLGKELLETYRNNKKFVFVGASYDLTLLDNLRYFSRIYFHGHTVGGTNPSLLEAMASEALICAHNNEFNKYILGEDAFYFSNSSDLDTFFKKMKTSKKQEYREWVDKNKEKISKIYSIRNCVSAYVNIFREAMKN